MHCLLITLTLLLVITSLQYNFLVKKVTSVHHLHIIYIPLLMSHDITAKKKKKKKKDIVYFVLVFEVSYHVAVSLTDE